MNSMKSIGISKNFALSLAAIFLWTALGGGILQFLMGSTFLGGLFVLVGIVLILLIIDGRLIRYLIGRRILRTNIYLMIFVLVLIVGNEIYALTTSRSITDTIQFAHIFYVIGFCLFLLVMIWQVIISIRSNK